MQLSLNAIAVLKHVLTYDGKKEIAKDDKGKDIEVNSARKLDPVEGAQRRFFFKNVEGAITEAKDKITAELELFKEARNAKKAKLEKAGKENVDELLKEDKDLNEKLDALNALNKELNAKVIEFQLEPQTKEVVKKYFDEYGKDIKFAQGDDDSVAEIQEALK